jgi:uncharacterized membrane protein
MRGYRNRIWLQESQALQAVGKLPAPAVADIRAEEPALALAIVRKINLRRGFAMSINPKTTAAIGDHPLHPVIIPFPIAFLVGAPIADLAFIGTGDGFWARAAIWLLGAGIVMALVAAVAGFVDFLSEPRIRGLNDAWYHMIGNLVAVVLAAINFYLRYAQGAEAAVKPWGVALSLIVVGILLFTGWKGWEMVYRHHVAVLDAPGQTSSEPVTPHHGGERHRRAA